MTCARETVMASIRSTVDAALKATWAESVGATRDIAYNLEKVGPAQTPMAIIFEKSSRVEDATVQVPRKVAITVSVLVRVSKDGTETLQATLNEADACVEDALVVPGFSSGTVSWGVYLVGTSTRELGIDYGWSDLSFEVLYT